MKRIKAYHAVFGDYRKMYELVRQGELQPAVYRLVPDDLLTQCGEWTDRPPISQNLELRRALEEIAQAQAAEVVKFQKEHGLTSSRHRSSFECADLMAGDLGCIFLSVGGWIDIPQYRDLPANGFVFDAEELLELGARLRAKDAYEYYHKNILSMAEQTFDSVAEALAEVQGLFDRMDEADAKGAKALQVLHDQRRRKREMEILFCGPLPIRRSIEVWVDGERDRWQNIVGEEGRR